MSEATGAVGSDAPGGDASKKASKKQSGLIRSLRTTALKLIELFPESKVLLLIRSGHGEVRDRLWLADLVHNFGNEAQADALRRVIMEHLSKVGAPAAVAAGPRRRHRAAICLVSTLQLAHSCAAQAANTGVAVFQPHSYWFMYAGVQQGLSLQGCKPAAGPVSRGDSHCAGSSRRRGRARAYDWPGEAGYHRGDH